jgi:hypothetical protein
MSNDTTPVFEIYNRGGANLGRCYNAQYFEIRSSTELSKEQLDKLRNSGLLSYGQEFYVKSTKEDGRFVYNIEVRVDSGD